MNITINGLECEWLECEYCGAELGILEVKNLSNKKVLCEDCIKNKTYEELGIEPMDKE